MDYPKELSSEEISELLYTSTSKGQIAYTTCKRCPDPRKNDHWYGAWYSKANTLGGYRWHYRYTERCKECNTKMQRKMRAKRLLQDVILVQDFTGLRVRWVTLTAPNYTDITEGLADFKAKVRRFRERVDFKSKVIGQVEFYEWTSFHGPLPDGVERTYNVHLHALWIGDYWKQADLLESWGEGGARIEDASTRSRKCLNYVISYAKKQAQQGIRTQQRGGCLYGPAFAALKSAAMLNAESYDAADAPE